MSHPTVPAHAREELRRRASAHQASEDAARAVAATAFRLRLAGRLRPAPAGCALTPPAHHPSPALLLEPPGRGTSLRAIAGAALLLLALVVGLALCALGDR